LIHVPPFPDGGSHAKVTEVRESAEKVVQTSVFTRHPLLLVDDSAATLVAYRAVLEPLDHEIVTATSGAEAVQLLAGRQFALLLVDVRMPGLDGFATVELVRRELHRETPVIFVTGADDEAAMHRAYEFGAVDYLMKPVDSKVLRGKVRNLIALYEQAIELEHRATQLVEQQQRLAAATDAVRRQDTNIGVLAHDLRNPLAAIATLTGILRRVPGLPERAQGIAERIDRSGRRMALMIRDILDFTRGRVAGGIALDRQPVDAHTICRSTVDEIQSAHPAARIEIVADGDLRGAWDNARIEQALSNLLANAVQHGGGDVTVSLSGSEPDHVTLAVRNKGNPIPSEQLPVIFDAFRKGDGSPAGLGLGLFIVREIVHAHVGTIEAQSSRDETTFTMRLPRHDAG
jgi:two-component system, sensor histidine kinase and response regulator